MDKKKSGWLFLSITMLHIVVVLVLSLGGEYFTLDLVSNLIVSELILLVPGLFFLFFTKGSLSSKLGLGRIKISTVFLVVIFTFLTIPLTTVINAISMLFVDNAVLEISGGMVSMPFFLIFFLMAIYGPVCEELVFRGLIYHGYKNSGTILQAMILSALLFGIMHMNFNQAPYAFVIGVFLILLKEATGSIIAPIIYHILFNGQSVILMYLTEYMAPGLLEQEAGLIKEQELLLYTIGIYIIIAAVTTTFAIMLLGVMAKQEGRALQLKTIWRERKQKRGNIITIPLAFSVIICLLLMIWDVIIL